jgi:hypothetical protein
MKSVITPDAATARELARLKFSPRMNRRLHKLMSKNTEGTLSKDEREELEALAEFNSTMSLLKAKAMVFLGVKPAVQ